MEHIQKMRGELHSFQKEHTNVFKIEEFSKGFFDRSIPLRFALLTKENYDFFMENEMLVGDIATVISTSNQTWKVRLGTNDYHKKIIRELAKQFSFMKPVWSYDQLTPPEWEFYFLFSTVEEVLIFLHKLLELQKEYPVEYPKYKEMVFVYSAAPEIRDGESFTIVRFMEKEDWEIFKIFMYEHYHAIIPWIKSIIEELGLKILYDSHFKTNHEVSKVKEVFSKYPQLEHDGDFHKFVNENQVY